MPSDEIISYVLKAAQLAPSWANTQCWEFILVKNESIRLKLSKTLPESSYPFEIFPFEFREILPVEVTNSIRNAMENFSRKIKNFQNGIMLGFESKTSSPIQVIRDREGLCEGFTNLFNEERIAFRLAIDTL